ncbi:myosin-9-like [Phyllostomus discolor]|uniref:Myosin-9-like n=1 Tax=Phyllostomus discolor TaxID=89673 RepID=A0A7E6D197_9CHIR|nr:myosin-9-like [Phyllostomus discolor]
MASEAGNVDPESGKILPAIEFLWDLRNIEKLRRLLSAEAWQRFVAAASVPREEADALYEELNQLKRLMAAEDEQMLSDEQRHREMFLKKFPVVEQEIGECIAHLHALADNVDQEHRDCTISNVVASSTGAVSGTLTIVGLSLGPMTAGASLVLAATGLGAIATVTSVSASVTERVGNKSAKAEACRLVSDAIDNEVVMQVLSENAPGIASLAKGILSLYKIVKNIRASNVAKAKPLIEAEVRFLVTTVKISMRSSRELQAAFGIIARAVAKGAGILTMATAGVFLLLDAVSLVKETTYLCEGSKSESAAEVRQQAQELEGKLEGLRWIHEILQEAELEHRKMQVLRKREGLQSSKDEMNVSVQNLLECKKALEDQREDMKTQLENLVAGLQATKDDSLQLEMYQCEQKLQGQSEQRKEKRQQDRQVWEMEAELEDERKKRSMAVACVEELQITLKDLEADIDSANENHEEAIKQLRNLEAQMKDCTRELEVTRASHEEMLAQVKENQEKRNSMEAEMIKLQEVQGNLQKDKQTLEHERGELAKQVKVLLQERQDSEHRWQKAEAQLQELQVKLKEGEPVRTQLQAELDRVTGLLGQSDRKCSQLSKDVSTVESQLQDTQELLQQQDQQKQGLSTRLQQVEEENRSLKEQLEQEKEAKHNLEKQIATLHAQVW